MDVRHVLPVVLFRRELTGDPTQRDSMCHMYACNGGHFSPQAHMTSGGNGRFIWPQNLSRMKLKIIHVTLNIHDEDV